jgi:hypothetical protein
MSLPKWEWFDCCTRDEGAGNSLIDGALDWSCGMPNGASACRAVSQTCHDPR